MKLFAAGGSAGLLGLFASPLLMAEKYEVPAYAKGMAPVKIKSVKAIATAPDGINLIVVKVETTEPGLYGLGCATFTQRAEVVVTAIDNYLNDFCVGRDADNIEDMWQNVYVSSYWRNGGVLNNAISGLDQALWDIKGKRAGMPVYQLLGGKSRFAVQCYTHASGRSNEEVIADVQKYMAMGYQHIRIQLGAYGGVGALGNNPAFRDAGFGMETDDFMDQRAYLNSVPKMFEAVRKACGDKVELLHDIHERVEPLDAINLIKKLEEYNPFFIEDPFSPENMEWFKQLRIVDFSPYCHGRIIQ